MTEISRFPHQSEYNTTINVIGGIRDSNEIFNSIASYLSSKGMHERRAELDHRTAKSRARVELAVRQAFLDFKNEDHRQLFESLFKNKVTGPDRELFLFWQFVVTNRLFREISINVFLKGYFAGRAGINHGEICAYLKEHLIRNRQLDLGWSDNTVSGLATKYLSLLTKLKFLEGSKKKTYLHQKISPQALVVFLYFARIHEPQLRDIKKSSILPASFILSEDILEKLKKLSLQGYFEMNFNGVNLNIDLTHGFKEICDVIYI